MYESSDKDEEGKRQGTRKSEADEEDDDYPAANSLDLIKDLFLFFRLFFLFSASIIFFLLPFFFPFFFFFSPSVACCGVGWHGWRGWLWSFVCRLKRIYKRISNGFKTHCHKRISDAFRRRSEMFSKTFPATRSKMHLKRAFRYCCCNFLFIDLLLASQKNEDLAKDKTDDVRVRLEGRDGDGDGDGGDDTKDAGDDGGARVAHELAAAGAGTGGDGAGTGRRARAIAGRVERYGDLVA